MNAFLAGKGGGDFYDDDDDSNNNHKYNDHKDNDARTTPTSFSDATTLLWLDVYMSISTLSKNVQVHFHIMLAL